MRKVIDILNILFPEREFVNSQDFIEDGLIDSFDLMQLISTLENEFGIEIDIDEINEDNFKNIESIDKLIKMRKDND